MNKGPFTFIFSTIFLLSASVVSAQSVDIIWQGDGYTPPFYKGRTAWSYQSGIILTAIPHGLGNPKSLNYEWVQNGTVLGEVSGVGRNTLSFSDTILSKPQEIEIRIISSKDDTLAKSSTIITPVAPSLLVYEDNPLYGFLFHREVGDTYRMGDAEVTLTAFPLFFVAEDMEDRMLSYKWSSNAGGSETRSSVTYRAPEGKGGSSNISLRTSSSVFVMQSASKNFLIQFGNENE